MTDQKLKVTSQDDSGSEAVTEEPAPLITGKHMRPLLVKQSSLLKTSVQQCSPKTTENIPINNVRIYQHLPTQSQQQNLNARKNIITFNTSLLEKNNSHNFRLTQVCDDIVPDCSRNMNSKIYHLKPKHAVQSTEISIISNTEATSTCSRSISDDTTSDYVTKRPSSVTVPQDGICITDPSCSEDGLLNVTTKKQKIIPKTNVQPHNVVLGDALENLKESDVDSLCSGQGFRECMYPCLACGEVFLMQSSLAQHRKTYHDDSLTF